MKNWMILGVLAVLLGACTQAPNIHSPESEYYRQQEAQVLVDLFDEVISLGEYVAMPPPPDIGSELLSDTVSFTLYVADSLIPLRTHWFYSTLKKDNTSGDPSEDVLRILADSITTSASISPELVQLIRASGFFMSADKSTARFQKQKHNAHLLFSRVSFNKSFTEACFLQDYGCGSECGGGTLVVTQKVKDQWIITRRQDLWVR